MAKKPDKKVVTFEDIIAAHKENPTWSAPELARHLGVHPHRIYNVGYRYKLPIPKRYGSASLNQSRDLVREMIDMIQSKDETALLWFRVGVAGGPSHPQNKTQARMYDLGRRARRMNYGKKMLPGDNICDRLLGLNKLPKGTR